MSVDVSIVTSGHDVADARLHREAAALLRRGLRVEVRGLGEPSAGPAGCQVVTTARRGPAGRLALALTIGWRARGRVVLALDPDTALGAWPAARVRRRRLVADVHEDYAALLRDRAWAHGLLGRASAGLVRLASAAAARADLTVVADEHVPPPTARRRLVLRNLPDPSIVPPPGPPDAAPRAVYIGDVRRSRGAFAMVEAVAAAPGWTLDVVGPVAAADAAALDRRIAQDDVRGRVHLHGRRPPAQAWQVASGAWVGLCLLDDTPAFRDAVPSKLYEYLAAGLAVVCTDLPRQAELARGSGGGVVVPPVGTAAATAAVLRDLSTDAGRLRGLRDAGPRWAAEVLTGDGYAEFAEAVGALVDA